MICGSKISTGQRAKGFRSSYPKERKVNGHDNEGEDPSQPGNKGTEEGAHDSRTDGEKESDEGDPARDRVQNHGMSETVGRGGSGPTEAGAVDLGHDDGWLVADVLGEAEVLIGSIPSNSVPTDEMRSRPGRVPTQRGVVYSLYGWNVENAVAEGAKGDGGGADVGVVGEHDFEDGDVFDDGGGDGGDQEEDGGDEEEGDAQPAIELLVMSFSYANRAWEFSSHTNGGERFVPYR